LDADRLANIAVLADSVHVVGVWGRPVREHEHDVQKPCCAAGEPPDQAISAKNIDRLSEQTAALDTTIEEGIVPFASQVAQLDEVTGVGVTAAQELIAEVGVDRAASPLPRTRCRGPSSALSSTSWPVEETQGSRQGQPVGARLGPVV
jgi:hypothetical protein